MRRLTVFARDARAVNWLDYDDFPDPVAKSPKEFRFRQPIDVDADGVIVGVRTRFKAALRLGVIRRD